jgi:hypothetical protein
MANLNATSREWVGINELMSTAMGIVTLPATMDLLNFGVIPLFDALTNLPEGAKEAIGLAATALEGIGGVMMTGGQLMLGLDSTANLLAKIAGVDTDIIFTSKGLSALSDKLPNVSKYLKKIGKLAVIGVTLSEVKNDIEEGEFTAAVGTALAGYGVLKGNKYMVGIGLALKLVGDEDAQAAVARMLILIGDKVYTFAEWAADTLTKVFTFNFDEIDVSFFTNFMDTYWAEAEKLQKEGKLTSDILNDTFSGMSNNAVKYSEDLDKINEKYEKGGVEWTDAIDALNDKYAIYVQYLKDANIELDGIITKSDKVNTVATARETNLNLGQSLQIDNNGKWSFGESVPNNSSQENKQQPIAVNTTYNVTVSDKREFEKMLKENTTEFVNKLNRTTRIP